MIIDAHAHVIPREFPPSDHPSHPRMTACDGEDARVLSIEDVEFTAPPVWFEADRRLAAMDAHGVDAEIVAPMPPLLNYRLDPEAASGMVRHTNEWLAALAAEGGPRIQALGIVPLQDPDAAAGELAGVVDLGLRGIEVGSHINGVSIGDPRFLDFFREVESLGLSVFVHAIRASIGDRLPAAAGATFGFGTEATLAAATLVTGGTLAACPDLRISISHGAGGFPLLLPRAQFFSERVWGTRDLDPSTIRGSDGPTPIELARRLYYDSLIFDSRAVDLIALTIGVDRILLGSDFPAIPREQPATYPLHELSGGSEALEQIAGANALAFLGIGVDDL